MKAAHVTPVMLTGNNARAAQFIALAADGGFGDETQPYQQAADRDVVVLLLGERDAELVGRDQALLDQQFPESEFLALFGHVRR